MAISRPQGIPSILGLAQVAFALLPLLWLGTALTHAASAGFEPTPASFPRPSFEGADASQYLLDFWRGTRRGVANRTIAFWGLSDDDPADGVASASLSADGHGVRVARALMEAGVQLRIVSPHLEEQARALKDASGKLVFDDRVTWMGQNAIDSLTGVDGLLLVSEWPEFLAISPTQIAQQMRGRGVFDGREALDATALDAAGLNYYSFAKPGSPPWLDPDFQNYMAHLRESTEEDDAILMLPGTRLGTTSGRARWFLHMNYQLTPRELYLWRPELACGTSGQYRQWVDAYNKAHPWKKMGRPQPGPRELSKLVGNTPARFLNAAESNAAAARKVDSVLFWTHNSDFRVSDWENIPIEKVGAGAQR
ncbi:MAG: hypothetical protein HN844_00215 [Planctomycetes bacterium]|nr:hypothetical protein [Planctomycetota bacterium]